MALTRYFALREKNQSVQSIKKAELRRTDLQIQLHGIGDAAVEYVSPPEKTEAVRPLNYHMPFEYERPRSAQGASVIVVGGGLAGLMAGWALARQRYAVTILEAQDKVGGRVDTREESWGLLEAGAELIGQIHTRWVTLAHHFCLGLTPISTDVMYEWQRLTVPLKIDGQTLEDDDPRYLQLEDDLKAAYSDLTHIANRVDPYTPWTSLYAEELDNLSVGRWLSELRQCNIISDLGESLLRHELEVNQTVPIDNQSMLGLLAAVRGGVADTPLEAGVAPYWNDSETFRCSSGNQSLAFALQRACKEDGALVMTNQCASEIAFTNDGVCRVTTKTASTKNRTLCHEADWIVLAIPPTMWHRIKFSCDDDTREKLAHYQTIQTGKAVKYLARVDERFWLAERLAPSATSTTLGEVWEGTDNQNIAPKDSKELTVFAGGRLADPATWQGDPHTYFRNGLDELYAGFLDHNSRKECELIDWPNDPWAKCAYSCPGLNQVTGISQHFAKPLGRLVFAGEHTSTAFFGYMEGALESGMRAAELIFQETGVTPVQNP